MRCSIAASLFFIPFLHSAVAQSSLASRVLVVYTSTDPASVDVANHYQSVRGIPQSNMCDLNLTDIVASTDITPSDYVSKIRTPVRNCLTTVGASNILYIVLAYVRPFRINDMQSILSAVDSFLADPWDQYTTQY